MNKKFEEIKKGVQEDLKNIPEANKALLSTAAIAVGMYMIGHAKGLKSGVRKGVVAGYIKGITDTVEVVIEARSSEHKGTEYTEKSS